MAGVSPANVIIAAFVLVVLKKYPSNFYRPAGIRKSAHFHIFKSSNYQIITSANLPSLQSIPLIFLPDTVRCCYFG